MELGEQSTGVPRDKRNLPSIYRHKQRDPASSRKIGWMIKDQSGEKESRGRLVLIQYNIILNGQSAQAI